MSAWGKTEATEVLCSLQAYSFSRNLQGNCIQQHDVYYEFTTIIKFVISDKFFISLV